MARLVMAVLLTVTAVAAAPAEAAGPTGQPCTYAETATGDGRRAGVVTAGPYAADGTITCAVQFGAGAHRAPDDAAVSASGSGVVVLAPRIVAAEDIQAGPAYVCTTFSTPHAELYWSGGRWTADAGAACDPATATVPAVTDTVPPIPLSGSITISSDVSIDEDTPSVNFVPGGFLALPALWDCSISGGPGGPISQPYEVVCTPYTEVGIVWSCIAVTAQALAVGYPRVSDVLSGVDAAYRYGERAAADVRDAVGSGGIPEIDPGPDLPPELTDPITWGEVATTAECADDDGWAGVTTRTATQTDPYFQADGTVAAVPVTAVRCRAAAGSAGPPRQHFTSICRYG
ncbi:MAG TPA: hypothetical protein VNA20_12885 [Frankiaceae bacterium]|nr:hypothetical protein [Frankiaceae bacterium]